MHYINSVRSYILQDVGLLPMFKVFNWQEMQFVIAE